jgi:basic membrane protein A
VKKNLIIEVYSILATMFAAACTPQPVDCSLAEIFCAGLVSERQEMNDTSFDHSAWKAMQQAEEDGLVQWIAHIETADSRDIAKDINFFTTHHYDLIVTIGREWGEATMSSALLNPDTMFVAVEQPMVDFLPENVPSPKNYAGLVFPQDQAGFLAGALAAMMTRTNHIGAVCASEELPAFWLYCEGYRAGSIYINPMIHTAIVYHNDVDPDKTANDPVWGAETARSLIEQGADVIFGSGGETGNGAIEAAVQSDAYAIGAEADQYYSLPYAAPRLLTSIMFQIENGVYELIRKATANDFPGGEDYSGSIACAPFHETAENIPEDVKARTNEILSALQDGSLETGVIPRAIPEQDNQP